MHQRYFNTDCIEGCRYWQMKLYFLSI